MNVKDPSQLAEYSWELINQALSQGVITLENAKSYTLDVELLVRLIQWTATIKAKKPHTVPPPEDFILKPTTGEGDEKED